MKNLTRKLLSSAAVGVLSLGGVTIGASAASAANVTNCANAGQFFTVWNNDGAHCFANAGSLNVYITKVYQICGGNNSGRVLYDSNKYVEVGRNKCVNMSIGGLSVVNNITIY